MFEKRARAVRILTFVCAALTTLLTPDRAQATVDWQISIEGRALVYTPRSLASGKHFSLHVLPAKRAGSEEFKTWFGKVIKATQDELGEPALAWKVTLDDEQVLRASNRYTDSQGEQLEINYRGVMLDGERYLLAYLLSDADVPADSRHVVELPEIMAKATELRAATSGQQAAINRLITRSDGHGVQDQELESVWLHIRFEPIYGGLDVTVSLLFKDGSLYRSCQVPIDTLDTDASRRLEPEQWSTWRVRRNPDESSYEFFDQKKQAWIELPGRAPQPAASDVRLDKKYTYSGGGGVMSMTSPQAFWRGIQLFADGRFETSSALLLGSPNSLNSGSEVSPSIHAASSSDAEGSRSSVSVQARSVAGGVSQTQADGSAHRGRYHIGGYVIELDYDNGTTRRELFLQSSGGNDAIVVGDTYYWVKKKEK